jgi:hypothetical protein
MTREEWATAFLEGIGAPVNRANLYAIVSWIQAEGGNAKANPLNTTHEAPGATTYNSAGVKNYPTVAVGLQATIETLEYGAERDLYGYRPIKRNLRRGRRAGKTLRSVEHSIWGTGGLALKVLPYVKRYWDQYRIIPIQD